MHKIVVAVLGAALLASGTIAQDVDHRPIGYAELVAMPVPVIKGDITDHPYHVIGHIKTNVRKATMFSHASSDDKMARELWERGKKMGADAVINATYGDEHISALSWGASTARGDAVKFVDAGK